MREIKFRCFDRKTGDVFLVNEMEWNNRGELFFFKGRYDYEKDVYTVGGGNPNKMTGTADHKDGLVKRYEIMQYTGLKDVNGVEIYEGDIMDCWISDYLGESRNVKLTIKNPFEYELVELTQMIHAISEWTVVGNIYKNPGMLGA